MLLWIAPHPGVDKKHTLDSLGSFLKRRLKAGWGGKAGVDLERVGG